MTKTIKSAVMLRDFNGVEEGEELVRYSDGEWWNKQADELFRCEDLLALSTCTPPFVRVEFEEEKPFGDGTKLCQKCGQVEAHCVCKPSVEEGGKGKGCFGCENEFRLRTTIPCKECGVEGNWMLWTPNVDVMAGDEKPASRSSKDILDTILADEKARGFPNDFEQESSKPSVEGEKSWFIGYLARQIVFSEKTFGHGTRFKGICEHIRKELCEIEAKPHDLMEWVDVMILAFDGAWRAGYTAGQIQDALTAKQAINISRDWPKPTSENEPCEHVRTPKPVEGEKSLFGMLIKCVDDYIGDSPLKRILTDHERRLALVEQAIEQKGGQ